MYGFNLFLPLRLRLLRSALQGRSDHVRHLSHRNRHFKRGSGGAIPTYSTTVIPFTSEDRRRRFPPPRFRGTVATGIRSPQATYRLPHARAAGVADSAVANALPHFGGGRNRRPESFTMTARVSQSGTGAHSWNR